MGPVSISVKVRTRLKVILLGASGMIGQGVLRECLLDSAVDEVLAVGRSPLPAALTWPRLGKEAQAKLHQLFRKDLNDLEPVEVELRGFNACFFCLGVSAARMTEEAYRRVTFDLTVHVAETLVKLNEGMTFIYVSGAGTDGAAQGRTMWARVKGETENALLRLPFKAAYMFRPGGIVPMHGIVSKTRVYQAGYMLAKPVLPLLKRIFPQSITTTEQMGRAMLRVARDGYPTPILEASDICQL
jgi:uncharacterized protein YbjT (DUF2867 family)